MKKMSKLNSRQMAITKCINCDKKIGLFNKPMFGYGKLKDGTGKSETILKTFRCNFSEHIGILLFTEFQMILIVDGIFSMDAVRVYYYNQISRLKVEEKSFKFKDSHNGYEGEMESFSKFNRTEFQNCVELLKEQIKVHKKYDKDSFPYLIQSYTSRKIGKEEFMNELKDWK